MWDNVHMMNSTPDKCMKVGDLVRCWHGPLSRAMHEMIGIVVDAIDAPDEVEVYVPSENVKYWFSSDEYEVINESR